MSRREYPAKLIINFCPVSKIIVDSHYEEKHGESIDDKTIIALVNQLDGRQVDPEKEQGPFSYFVNDQMELNGKFYKLVWLLENDHLYIGVINCYRR